MELTWSDLCRCCLSPNSEVSLLDEELNVKEKFLEVTTVEVSSDDGLPQKMCTDCYTIMNSAYQFRNQCIKMDAELKIQLEDLLREHEQNENNEDNLQIVAHEEELQPDLNIRNIVPDSDDISNDAMKQLEAIIKAEPTDSDDDFYYVLVIDEKEKPKDKNKSDYEKELPPVIKQEPKELREESASREESREQTTFENSYDSFLNTKVPVNVPATILENEEEGQDMEEGFDNNLMDINDRHDNGAEESAPHIEDSQNDDDLLAKIPEQLSNKNNIIKILAANSDGTLILKGNDGIQYLTDPQYTNADSDDAMNQEVIFCEGDESQFQILKCEGSELVIEYADSDQIATVLQQEDGTFLCECGEQFEDLAEYEQHQYKHNPAGEHLCNMCGKGFESAEILTGHLILHTSTGLLVTCPFCNQLIRRSTLTQHIKYGHNNIKPQCDICSKTFANPNNLKRHMMIHKGIREFECDICLKRFHQKITMQTHRLTHINPFACNQCDNVFDNKIALVEHRDSNECTKSKITKVKQELIKTLKQEVTTNVGKLLGYACSLCKKMFSLESALEEHVETTHMADPSELLCSECGEVMPSKKEMQSHLSSHKNYKQRNLKRFECRICNKGCSSQAMLLMHERVHTNERPFQCGLCSLKFKTKTHLRTHQLTHTREKKFGCSVCMKFFALKGNLVVHLRTHTGERPYVCDICEEAFIDSKYLKKHKLKKHSLDNNVKIIY